MKLDIQSYHEDLTSWIQADLERRGFSWEQMESGNYWATSGKREPGRLPFYSFEELTKYVILADPVHFAECMLFEREVEGNPPWRVWAYQAISARYRGDVLHQDGAEVGKTREIILLLIWFAVTRPGDQLVAAALDGHLELIYREVRWQLEYNPWLRSQINWKASTRKPYKDLVFTNGNQVFFRPVGQDGAALRSIHVGRALYLDEAAKVKGKLADEAFANFFSRGKPTAETRIYSVPDGDRKTPYYDLCVQTPEVDPFNPPPAPGKGEQRRFIKFRWPKRLMKAPWWSAQREQEFIERYGGEFSSKFQQNVEGNHGNPIDAVFPWADLRPCLSYLADYRAIEIVRDISSGTLRVRSSSLNADYRVQHAAGDSGRGEVVEPMRREFTTEHQLAAFEHDGTKARVRAWIDLLSFIDRPSGHLAIGVDFGAVKDPTEILVGRVRSGHPVSWVLRVQLRSIDYTNQAAILFALQALLQPSHGWGLDATGAPASEEMIRRPLQLGGQRLQGQKTRVDYTGYVMNATTARLDDEGRPMLGKDGKEERISYLELGVQRLELGVQRRTIAMPFDPVIMKEFPQFRSELLPTGRRKFSKTGDHLVAAAICLHLRIHEMGARPTLTLPDVPPGPSRDSWRMFMEDGSGW